MRSNIRYRSYNTSGIPTGVKWLLIINVALFLLEYLGGRTVSDHFLLLRLVPDLVVHKFFLWQLLSYMFLHAGIEHILFNMLALWMFGSVLERDWGTRQFLKYYFLCGAGAGLCDVVL